MALGKSSSATAGGGAKAFMVVGHDEAFRAVLDTENFSNKVFERILGLSFGKTITAMDAPEHTRYRKIFQRAFSPNAVRQWSDTLVDPVVDDLIAAFNGNGKADLIEDFTKHYPFRVIYGLLKLPTSDIVTFHKLTVALTNLHVDPHGRSRPGKNSGAISPACWPSGAPGPGTTWSPP